MAALFYRGVVERVGRCSPNVLAQPYRLTKTADFDRVRMEGRRVVKKFYSFSYVNKGGRNPSRFGFIVSNKISNNATARNKIKRGLREAIRQSMSYIKPGFDAVFVAKKEAIRAYTDILMKDVKQTLDEAGLTK